MFMLILFKKVKKKRDNQNKTKQKNTNGLIWSRLKSQEREDLHWRILLQWGGQPSFTLEQLNALLLKIGYQNIIAENCQQKKKAV